MMKKFSLATLSLVCAATALHADLMGNKHTCPAHTDQPTHPQAIITPSANPIVAHSVDPYLTADFIWWRAQEDGLNFSFDGVSTTAGTDASGGHIHHPKFKYEPGFKVGFGLKFKHDGWDLYANYTWLRTDFKDTEKKVHTHTSSQLSNYFVAGTTPSFATIAGESKGEWAMHFNAVDLELARNFWVSQWLTLRPHFGMKSSWIEQDFNVKYDNASFTGVTAADVKIDNDLRQWAVGLRAGLDAAFYLGKKWCIFGEFAYSELWNHFDTKRKDTIATATEAWTAINTKTDSHSVTGVGELAVGLRFETAFHHDHYLFLLQAGWEEQIWFNQNQFFFIANTTPADLTFEGLTVKMEIAF